eukprot:TRINITY_DN818_c0_g2_i1.p1 TRINITY_DN818_c0_g2~~TRINITY_DN818_c0_g2_i1.p1  ORF type:complete len:262 (+),score=87.16 TRINITY_DN818_c0_g2_i1:181-966(+)
MKDESEKGERTQTRADCWTATTFFIIAMFMNCFTLNFAHWRMPDPRTQLPLRDVGFDLIPIIRLQWITDSMLGFFNGAVVALWLHAWYVENNGMKARSMWVKYFMVWGYCMAMRAFSIVLTSMPATENHCQNPKSIDNLWVNMILGFVTFGGKNVHCGDLLFSGHTINIVNGFMVISHYGWRFTTLVGCSAVCVLICLFLIIASRSHYTIDVYIGACISMLCFNATSDSIPIFLSPLSSFYSKFISNVPVPQQQGMRRWSL